MLYWTELYYLYAAILESIGISFKIQNQDIVVDTDSRLQRYFDEFSINSVIQILFRKKSPSHQGVVHLVMPQHLVEDYDSDISSSSLEDESKETEDQEVVYPEQCICQIKLTTPSKTEHDLLVSLVTSQSAPTSPTLKRHQIPVAVTNSSGEESGVESMAVLRQRSRSVEILQDIDTEDDKQSNPDYPAQNTKGKGFSRFTTGIANRLKSKNKFFGDSVTPSVPHDSESNVKPSAISTFKRTVASSVSSLKEKTQKKIKTKTNMISI